MIGILPEFHEGDLPACRKRPNLSRPIAAAQRFAKWSSSGIEYEAIAPKKK
jgi:hypothetical protein